MSEKFPGASRFCPYAIAVCFTNVRKLRVTTIAGDDCQWRVGGLLSSKAKSLSEENFHNQRHALEWRRPAPKGKLEVGSWSSWEIFERERKHPATGGLCPCVFLTFSPALPLARGRGLGFLTSSSTFVYARGSRHPIYTTRGQELELGTHKAHWSLANKWASPECLW